MIPDGFQPFVLLDEANARDAATRLLLWAVYGGDGADKMSERAAIVTENRNALSIRQGWGHSSCGDLYWFLRRRLGDWSSVVNRAELKGREKHPGYRYGGAPNNLSLIETSPDFVRGPVNVQMGAGDALLMDPSNMHVAVVLEHDPDAKWLVVAQYGGTMGATGIDGRRSEYPSDWHPNIIGQQVRGLAFDGVAVAAENKTTGQIKMRKIIGHLPLWPAIERAKAEGRLESLIHIPEAA